MRRLTLIAALAALAATGAAAAGPDPLNGRPLAADADHDGKVSRAEYQASRRTYFMGADLNEDGRVSRAEWSVKVQKVRADLRADGTEGAEQLDGKAWWRMLDADRDGYVTPAEIDEATARRFPGVDTDNDGFIDRWEAARWAARVPIK